MSKRFLKGASLKLEYGDQGKDLSRHSNCVMRTYWLCPLIQTSARRNDNVPKPVLSLIMQPQSTLFLKSNLQNSNLLKYEGSEGNEAIGLKERATS